MQEQQLIVKNLKINYKAFGQGKPLLILHGWPSKSDTWIKTAELLEQKGMCVIVPDLPGFGKSQEPSQPWTMDVYVEWILEFCNQVPELKNSFYLLGHSFGGALAAKFAIKYAQRVEKVLLVSAAIVRPKTTKKSLIGRAAKVAKLFSFVPQYENIRKAAYKFLLRSDYPYVSGVMKETYLKVISDDLSHKVNFLKVPVSIIWGDQDQYTPIDQANFIHQKIHGSSLTVIPGEGHALQIKVPEILAEKITTSI